GTLDPFATGVLLITVGQATRLSEYTLQLPKTYTATIHLGATSTTDDKMGEITEVKAPPKPTKEDIETTLASYIGTIQQIPPAYAAIKVKGKKLYEYAREGKAVTVPPRVVHISNITLNSYEFPLLTISVTCSSGTYIRSLARDIGKDLGTGAYVQELRRGAIGEFNEQKAIVLETAFLTAWQKHLQPASDLIPYLPSIYLTAPNVAKFQSGGSVPVEHSAFTSPQPPDTTIPIAVFASKNDLIGIGQYDASTSTLSPQKVLTI
ncbi:MAG: tRNA pseudouridine(55) synthase TruB, partial [Candidatus Andersenbacteria bacterium]